MSKSPYGMVDVSGKPIVPRQATATGTLKLKQSTIKTIQAGLVKKGDPLAVAEIAAIQAVKKTPELLPMCHQIPLDQVDLKFRVNKGSVEAWCTVKATYRTGVEMEALTGVSVALLNIWDMVKYLEKDPEGQYPETEITGVRVVEKRKGAP